MLIELGLSNEQFLACAARGLENPEHKKYFEQIIACDNFLYFKSLMVMKNVQLIEQTYQLYSAQENLNTQNKLSNDEAYNTLLRIKEKTELECAIAMSLALAEEKSKIMGSDEDQEMLKAIEESKRIIQFRSNAPNLDYDDPISMFDRNTLRPREHHVNEAPPMQVSNNVKVADPSSFNKSQNVVSTPGNTNINASYTTKPKETSFGISNNNISINSEQKKVTSSFGDLKISKDAQSSYENKPKQQQQINQITKVNDLNIESNKDSDWKTGLNKQGNIDLAILSQTNRTGEGQKKQTKNILEMAGDVGSLSVTERTQADYLLNNKNANTISSLNNTNTHMNNNILSSSINANSSSTYNKPSSTQIPDDLFDNDQNKQSDFRLLDQKGLSSSAQGSSLINQFHDNKGNKDSIERIEVQQKKEEVIIEDSQPGISSHKVNNIGGKMYQSSSKEIDDSIEFNNKFDFSKMGSKVDNSADTSDFQKWKNYERKNIDMGLPDLTNVKSKIDTGLKEIKKIDKEFQLENDELKKKFEMLQKEKENKIKEYREMLLKMKADKSKNEMTNNDNTNLKMEMRKNLAEKLKK